MWLALYCRCPPRAVPRHSAKLALLPAAEFCPVGGKCSRSAPSGAGSQGTGLSCPLLPLAGLRGHHRGSPRRRFMSLGSCRWARWGSEVRAFRVSGWSRDSPLLGAGASSCCCARRVLLPQGSGSGTGSLCGLASAARAPCSGSVSAEVVRFPFCAPPAIWVASGGGTCVQDPPEITGVLGSLQCVLSVVQPWFLRARWTPAARYGGCFLKWSFSPGCLVAYVAGPLRVAVWSSRHRMGPNSVRRTVLYFTVDGKGLNRAHLR